MYQLPVKNCRPAPVGLALVKIFSSMLKLMTLRSMLPVLALSLSLQTIEPFLVDVFIYLFGRYPINLYRLILSSYNGTIHLLPIRPQKKRKEMLLLVGGTRARIIT